MKGTRPYYIISYIRDYDGYDVSIEYIGTNYKAALDRYAKIFQYIKQRDFLEEDVEEENIEQRLHLPDGKEDLAPGHCVASYINDGNEFYGTIKLECVLSKQFLTRRFEEEYRAECPNSKY